MNESIELQDKDLSKQINLLIKERIFDESNNKWEFVKPVKSFGLDFWFLVILSVLDKTLIPPFIQNASEMFQ
jgi:hypothetical protein